MDWTEKYRPTTLQEVRGNNKARDQLRDWAETWDDHREAVIVHGSPGVGKTSAAHALAADLGWEAIELNASDQRTAAIVERIAGEAALSGTLAQGSAGRKLIILDEADNLHGNVDRGGTRAMSDLVREANQPVILIANEYYEMSQGLRRTCQEIEFRDVSARSIIPVLRDICRREEIEYEEEALETLAEKNAGDLRGAINDLQAIAEQTDILTIDDVVTGNRDRTRGIFDFLDLLIKEADAQSALHAAYDVDETPDDLIHWIEDNLPKDYHGAELTEAYGFLSNADRWLGRVRATQNYSYWRYVTDNMTAGVAAARQGEKGGWTRYNPPSYWSKLGRSRSTRDKRDYVARHIAETSAVSMTTARRDILPFLEVMTHHCGNRELTVAMTAIYNLEPEHVSFVTGSGQDTNKVQDIVADAAELREATMEAHSEGAFSSESAADTDEAEMETLDEPADSAGATNSPNEAETTQEEETEEENTDVNDEEVEEQANFSDFT